MGEQGDDFIEWLMRNARYICFRTWEYNKETLCTSQLYFIYKSKYS